MKKELKSYHKKRNFSVSTEPTGHKKVKRNKSLIFVVQEHHASHLHYDFRLELDGVLKSWAVPKGPSLNPEDKRLAVEVEDHPLDYASFHGTIPKGEYGGGEVYIWDKGTWIVKGDPHTGLKEGKLEFSLKGKKLKGHFVLVRLPDRKSTKKHNWLLMKRTDAEADTQFELEPIVPEISNSTEMESPKKKDKWPGFINPQLAFLVDTPPESDQWVHEIKFDGYRLQPHIKNGKIKIFTRGAHDWTDQFPTIANALKGLDVESAILDGEAVVMDNKGRSNFSSLQNALSFKDYTNMRIYFFDLLYLNGEDLRKLPLLERKKRLFDLLKKTAPPLYYSEDVKDNGAHFFKMSCRYHLEGIVSKEREAPYTSGRSRVWCKIKCGHRQEFIIGGFSSGKGARESGFGALLIGIYDNIKGKKQLRYAGKVGTGFDNKTITDLMKKLSSLEQANSPFDLKSPAGKGIHWIKPKLVAEVSFSEWTADKILRTPVFIGLREDKSTKDIVMEKATHISQPEFNKIEKSEVQSTTADIVSLTHPEKIIFPEEKITKEQIAKYYASVSKLMLPFVADRPLSLVRCPQGGGKKCFYQKHPGPGVVPRHFNSFKVKEKTDSSIYLSLNSDSGLKQLVQMNAFEIHTWNCHYQSLMKPDQIVMDFDPDPSISFKKVVEACLDMKKTLDHLKLKSFVKVSGGKGIHIHIPIEPIYTWDQVKAFSKALADEMSARKPNEFLSTMSKEARKGKIFIDYLRNAYGATAVAPYALRAREISAVALPVEWNELIKIKSSDQFTLKKALLKIKKRKSDPWKNFFSVKQKITLLE